VIAGAEKSRASSARRSPGEVLKDAGSIPATSTLSYRSITQSEEAQARSPGPDARPGGVWASAYLARGLVLVRVHPLAAEPRQRAGQQGTGDTRQPAGHHRYRVAE